mmetsp:Transcript_22830/g.64176  ORF Transcript_22830/g.64176 Transcript_22830/m.64176 type:complete len:213 (+) Transcript_22830:305-943(+)
MRDGAVCSLEDCCPWGHGVTPVMCCQVLASYCATTCCTRMSVADQDLLERNPTSHDLVGFGRKSRGQSFHAQEFSHGYQQSEQVRNIFHLVCTSRKMIYTGQVLWGRGYRDSGRSVRRFLVPVERWGGRFGRAGGRAHWNGAGSGEATWTDRRCTRSTSASVSYWVHIRTPPAARRSRTGRPTPRHPYPFPLRHRSRPPALPPQPRTCQCSP